jgi:D-alanyl-D-alanine carboxypeptidase
MNASNLQKKLSFRDRVIAKVQIFNGKHKKLSFLGFTYAVCAITLYNFMFYFYRNAKRYTALACILLFFAASSSFSYPAMAPAISFESDIETTETDAPEVAVISDEEVAQSDAELVVSKDIDEEVLAEASEVINPDAAEIDSYASVDEILDTDEMSASESSSDTGSNELLSDLKEENAADFTDTEADTMKRFSREDWSIILVNKQHPIPDDYEFKLGTISGSMKCDERVITPLRDMVRAAHEDGVNLVICSPYRDINRQTMLFNNKVNRYMDGGMSYMDAYNLASQAVTVPGSSEHQIGLAVDIVTNGYTTLDEGFGETAAGKWLYENSARYGFILRYPKGKEHITSIEYEPWHFRYVGVEAATLITDECICLEEFWNRYVD